MVTVALFGWEPGANKVALTRLLQQRAGLSLAAAKHCTDLCLAGERALVSLATNTEAREFTEALAGIGVRAGIQAADEHRAAIDAAPGHSLA